MSEFTTNPGIVSLSELGLEIDSENGVRVRTPFDPPPLTPDDVVSATGKAGTDIIDASGGTFNYILRGGKGDDVLVGSGQNDVLIGGKDIDSLEGGAGADSFLFQKKDIPSEGDTIVDFEGKDRILLNRGLIERNLKAGKVSANDIAVVNRNNGKKADDLKQTLIYESRTGNVYYNKSKKNSDNDTLLVKLEDGSGDAPSNVSNRNFEIF